MNALKDLPPFAPVLDRLMATLSNETVSVARVSGIVEADTVIAGNVLKLVNSALYGRRGTVNSIRHAVSLLGINKLRNAVFAMSMTRVWGQVRTAPGWSTARFNQHAVACGLLCDCLAQCLPFSYPEGAFAAGLFHDLGALLIAAGLHDEFGEIQHLYSSGFGPIEDCENEVLGLSHADLSAEALEVWNLPSAIQQAVRLHHRPDQKRNPQSDCFDLALGIRCACVYIKHNDVAPYETGDSDYGDPEEPFAPMGLELSRATFLEGFRTDLEAMSGAFH